MHQPNPSCAAIHPASSPRKYWLIFIVCLVDGRRDPGVHCSNQQRIYRSVKCNFKSSTRSYRVQHLILPNTRAYQRKRKLLGLPGKFWAISWFPIGHQRLGKQAVRIRTRRSDEVEISLDGKCSNHLDIVESCQFSVFQWSPSKPDPTLRSQTTGVVVAKKPRKWQSSMDCALIVLIVSFHTCLTGHERHKLSMMCHLYWTHKCEHIPLQSSHGSCSASMPRPWDSHFPARSCSSSKST